MTRESGEEEISTANKSGKWLLEGRELASASALPAAASLRCSPENPPRSHSLRHVMALHCTVSYHTSLRPSQQRFWKKGLDSLLPHHAVKLPAPPQSPGTFLLAPAPGEAQRQEIRD